MDMPRQPAYLQEAQALIAQFFTDFQFPQERAAQLARQLVDLLRGTFEEAGQETTTPLLEALLHYSQDQSELGEIARQALKVYTQRYSTFAPSPEVLTEGLINIIDQANPEESRAWEDLIDRLVEQLPPDPSDELLSVQEDSKRDDWAETQGTGSMKLVGQGRLMIIQSSHTTDLIIAGLPPSGYGERPSITVTAQDVEELISVLQAAQQQ